MAKYENRLYGMFTDFEFKIGRYLSEKIEALAATEIDKVSNIIKCKKSEDIIRIPDEIKDFAIFFYIHHILEEAMRNEDTKKPISTRNICVHPYVTLIPDLVPADIYDTSFYWDRAQFTVFSEEENELIKLIFELVDKDKFKVTKLK